MRAARIEEIGVPPAAVTVADPTPSAGQSLISVTAASLNPVELRVAAGGMPGVSPPYVPGLEGVGTIVASESFPRGARVRFENDLPGFGKDGAIRESAVADDDAIVELPDDLNDAEVAASGVVGVTAELAFRLAGMTPGDRVAVLGATGGVGHVAVQLAATRGADSVVAVGRDQESLDWLATKGATATVNMTHVDDLGSALVEAAGGEIDVVVDPLWGRPAMAAIAALGEGGRLVTVGSTAGTEVELPLQSMRKSRSSVMGLSSGWTPLPEKLDAFRFVLDQMVAGQVGVRHEVVPLVDVATAWQNQHAHPHTKLVISLA